MSFYERKDHFYQKAKKEGYVARSAYKLIELDKQFRIFKPGSKIVDLGCAPGGWLQVAEERLKLVSQKRNDTSLQVVGIDLLPLKTQISPAISFIQGDFTLPHNQQKIIELLKDKADWVLSDMSPNISGIAFKDNLASLELCEMAYEFSKKILKKGGGLIVKIFPGPELGNFKKKLKESFQQLSTVLPEATRKTSTEIYLIAKNLMKGDQSHQL